ncbi:AAA family ATPase, partial [bacterium]|nr:AAA family ATPase [bacterium]
MRIKYVELVGFKSFVDKTRLSFHDGITVIVGPNGCGKSNVVDALRWVMGELSAKSLRGAEMQDVIFSGSASRKPFNMAQVVLGFSCEDGVHPIGYEGVTEIEICRRLHRDGESEYLINRVPCRLKDIQELLMDTGMSARTYAVIEQGQIARILSMKPQDRRFLIEEAAGTTKYRVRREETERKIASTQDNLSRVEDLLSEIRRNVNSLARQAGKARRWKEFSDELREVEIELAVRQAAEIDRQDADRKDRAARIAERIVSEEARLAAEESRLQARQLDHLRGAKSVEEQQAGLAKIQDELRRIEAEHANLTRIAGENEARQGALRQESETSAASMPELLAAADAALSETREADAGLEGLAVRLDEARGRLEFYRNTRRENSRVAGERREIVERLTRELATLGGQDTGDANRRARDEERIANLGAEIEPL